MGMDGGKVSWRLAFKMGSRLRAFVGRRIAVGQSWRFHSSGLRIWEKRVCPRKERGKRKLSNPNNLITNLLILQSSVQCTLIRLGCGFVIYPQHDLIKSHTYGSFDLGSYKKEDCHNWLSKTGTSWPADRSFINLFRIKSMIRHKLKRTATNNGTHT